MLKGQGIKKRSECRIGLFFQSIFHGMANPYRTIFAAIMAFFLLKW